MDFPGIEKYREQMANGKQAIGRKYLLRALDGKKLTQGQAIAACCYDCQGGYSDGIEDCGSRMCMLHEYSPYAPHNVERRRQAALRRMDKASQGINKNEDDEDALYENDEFVGDVLAED